MNWPGTDTGDGRHNKRVTLRWVFVLSAFAAVVLLISPPVAHADPATDTHFIDTLQNTGFVIANRDAAINNAHLVCVHLWAGDATVDDIAQQIDKVETNLDLSGSKAFVAIAIQTYCPDIGARSKM